MFIQPGVMSINERQQESHFSQVFILGGFKVSTVGGGFSFTLCNHEVLRNTAFLPAMRAKRLRGHRALCELPHGPQTKLVTLPIVFLLATTQITSEDAGPLYILFQDASDTCHGPGVQAGIILTLVVGESAEQAVSCLMVWWKENKMRVIKNNWNISSCCSATVPSLFIALIGSDWIKRRGVLSLFDLPSLVYSSQGSRYHNGHGYIWEAPCKIHGMLLWTVERVPSVRVPYMEGLALSESRLSLFLI